MIQTHLVGTNSFAFRDLLLKAISALKTLERNLKSENPLQQQRKQFAGKQRKPAIKGGRKGRDAALQGSPRAQRVKMKRENSMQDQILPVASPKNSWSKRQLLETKLPLTLAPPV